MGVAEAIAQLLRQAGVSVSKPSLNPEHGWEFVAEREGRKFWVLLTDLERTTLVQTRDVSPFLRRLYSGEAGYAAFLNDIYQCMSDDVRFNSIQRIN